jgi:hypothetical protein
VRCDKQQFHQDISLHEREPAWLDLCLLNFANARCLKKIGFSDAMAHKIEIAIERVTKLTRPLKSSQ